MKSATLTYGAGPGSTITLTPETVKVRDAIIAKFADKSLAELNSFIETALSTEREDNKRLGILAARVYILRMRMQNISSFNRDPSQKTLTEVTPASLTSEANTARQGSDDDSAAGETSQEAYQEWNELTITESGEINGVRIPKGVTITVGMEDARRLIETNKAVFAHAVAAPDEIAAPAPDSSADAISENSAEENLDAAMPASDNLAEDVAPVAETSDLSEPQPPQTELPDSEKDEGDDDDTPAPQK